MNTRTPKSGRPTQTKRTAGAADPWLELLQKNPFPYTTPLPPSSTTVLDGIYVKSEPKAGTPVPCRRCPDYLPEGGLWKLGLNKGAFRIFHPFTGWRSLGSFTVSDERFVIFNDPGCFDIVGVYTWRLEKGQLSFSLIGDPCHVGRRATSFTNTPWQACQPPSSEAAITNHWPVPPGCEGIE
jgi:hypothetical protein